jgi:hypothetical protein
MTNTTPLGEVLAAVDAGQTAATVRVLAAPSFAGRRAGSPGGAAARGRLGEHLAGLGARVSTASFAVRSVPGIYAVPEAVWHDGVHEHRLTFGRQVLPHLASADLPSIRRGSTSRPTPRWQPRSGPDGWPRALRSVEPT